MLGRRHVNRSGIPVLCGNSFPRRQRLPGGRAGDDGQRETSLSKMERSIKKSKLSKADSIEKLAAFWVTHDLTGFEGELEEVSQPFFMRDTAIKVRLNLGTVSPLRQRSWSRRTRTRGKAVPTAGDLGVVVEFEFVVLLSRSERFSRCTSHPPRARGPCSRNAPSRSRNFGMQSRRHGGLGQRIEAASAWVRRPAVMGEVSKTLAERS